VFQPDLRRAMKRLLGDKGTLAGLASRALGWSFFSTALGRLGTLGIGILLARLLGPHQFGTAAVAYVALIAVLSFNELGVSLAIVRWPSEPDEIAPTVSTISVGTSLLLFAGLYLAAPAFAAAMGAPDATTVVRVLALTIVTDSIVAVPAALLERNFRQDRRMIADQVRGWLGAAISVGMAWAGYGAMSLAVGQVVGAVAGGILIIIFAPLPLRLGFDADIARKLLKFGLPLAGSSLVVFLVGNVDNLVVGHMLGATVLGFYVLAWNLASWPVNMFSQPVRSVAPAMFSRLQHDPAAMRAGFTSAAGLLGAVTLPVCLLISGSAVPLIGFVYGAKWAPAAPALVWLAVLGALRILFELTYDYFVVLARSRVVFTVQVAWLLALIPSLIAGAWLGGIRGAAIAGVAVAAGVVLPWYLIELSRIGIKARALAARLWLPLLAAAAVGAAASAAAAVIPNDFAACAVGGVVSLIAIGLLLYRMRPALTVLRAAMSKHEATPTSAGEKAMEPAAAGRASALGDRGISRSPDPAGQAAALQALLAIAVPVPAFSYRDLTGPLPMYRDFTGAMPVYQEVVASVRWDPGADRRRIRGDDTGHMPEKQLARAWAAESAKYARARRQAAPGPVPARYGPARHGPAPRVAADIDPADGDGTHAHERRGHYERR
jgi:O-antigen/teichoic acid export membrane protein